MKKLMVVTVLATALFGCKILSSGDEDSDAVDNVEVDAAMLVPPLEARTRDISESEARDEILGKLEAQLDEEPDELMQVTAEVSCHSRDDLSSCLIGTPVRLQIQAKASSRRVQVTSETADIIWGKLLELRAELHDEEQILADISCRRYLEDIPPYEEGQRFCEVSSPRLPSEAYLHGAAAYELAAALRGNRAFAVDRPSVSGGSLVCLWQGGARPHRCVINSSGGGTGSYAQLSPAVAREIHAQVEVIYATVEPSLIRQAQIRLPPEQMLAANCTVQPSQIKPTAHCRVRIPPADI